MSATENKEIAFANAKNVIFKIIIKLSNKKILSSKALSLEKISTFRDEKEILF